MQNENQKNMAQIIRKDGVREVHIISVRSQVIGDELVIDLAGIDDTIIISLDRDKLMKLSGEISKAWTHMAAIKKRQIADKNILDTR